MNKKMSWIVGWTALAAFVIVLPHLLPNTYFIRILNMVGIYILLATGSNILTGYAGQLSMGQAAFYGVGAYTVGLMSMYLKADFLVILPVAILVACVFGIVLAVPALRLKGGYLTLLTIGFEAIEAGETIDMPVEVKQAIHFYFHQLGVDIEDRLKGLYYSIPD